MHLASRDKREGNEMCIYFETLALDPKKKRGIAIHTCTQPSRKEFEFERKYSLDDRRSVAMAVRSENVCEKSLS